MSELTPCNYCNLRWIRCDLKPGETLELRPAKDMEEFGGTDAIIKSPNEPERRAAWFMQLTEHCVC